MKKMLSILLLSGIVLGVTLTQAIATTTNPRYKAGQSNEEICIRNNGGIYACKGSADYSNTFADVIKNGGCITSVPDMGNMIRDWKYCQTTSEKKNIIYYPDGRMVVVNNDSMMVKSMALPPMTDAEYIQELREYNSRN